VSTEPRKVLIIDDSAVVRQLLTAVLDRDPGLRVSGTAADPLFAMERMKKEWPDVVVLDIEMPRMDGLTFLRKLMAVRPTPVVICSTLTAKGADTTLQALSAGAVGVITKPTSGLRQFLEEDAGDIVGAVRTAAGVDMRRVTAASRASAGGAAAAPRSGAPRPAGRPDVGSTLTVTTDRLVALGTSTGGTQALEVVLSAAGRLPVGMVIVQHMPEHFTTAFAARLNSLCASDIAEAEDGDRVLPGHILLAPGGRHMTVVRDGAQYRVRVADGPRVNRHEPSVDVLMESVARCAGANALGIILTGMGDDGARGLLQMRQAGAHTLGQDEASCVVYGMPRVARELGGVEHELPLTEMGAAIRSWAGRA